MITSHSRWLRPLFILLLLVMTFASLPGATLAQDPVPPTLPQKDDHTHSAEVYSKRENGTYVVVNSSDEPIATSTSSALTLGGTSATADFTEDADTQADAASAEAPDASAEAPTLLDPAAAPIYAASPAAANDVRVDVSVPGTVSAGDVVDYTYAYTNTTSAALNITLRVSWTNFSTTFNGNWQSCLNSGTEANCVPIAVAGPAVNKVVVDCPSGKLCYQVNGLPGQSAGKFNVRLGIDKARYPRTGEEIRRPASSVQLVVGTESTITSEDTANTLIVGPVLVPIKVAADPAKKIYPTITDNPAEHGQFNITLGNATGPKDTVNGQLRADARPATNIVLVDAFPKGGAYISSGQPNGVAAAVVDENAKTVTWTIPGPLNPGQTLDGFTVTYRKADENNDCDKLNNTSYSATSDQYPIDKGSTRYSIPGKGVSIPVVVPMKVSAIKVEPSGPYFGGQADIAITVQNYYNQALTGVKLAYTIQSNAVYLSGSANPAPSAQPPANQNGTVEWTFDMPAGDKTAPTEKVFGLRIQGGYLKSATAGTAQIIAPANVPSACIKTVTGRANFQPRLLVTKDTDVDPDTKEGSNFIVDPGQEFEFYITVENRGTETAPDVDITDQLPVVDGADFSYKVGSSRINGQTRDPDSFTNGREGTIFWNNLSVDAGQTLEIRYVLYINGYDYKVYCNKVSAVSGNSQDESIAYGRSSVCLKINPQIEITKTINGANDIVTVEPGAEVTFKLTLTNRESKAYTIGLVDKPDKFVYTSMVSGYDMAPTFDSGYIFWKLVPLAPGQTLEVVFKARVPTECVSKDYVNEAMLQSANTPGYVIIPIPRVSVKARVNCGKVEFRKDASAAKVSLEDRLAYTLKIKNTDGKPINDVQVEDVLPQGFSFVGMEAGSAVTTLPQIITDTLNPDRLQLTWKIPSIKANTEVLIKYVARSGIVVGKADQESANLARSIPGACPGACTSYNDNLYTYKAVEVLPLITAEPKITPDTCAVPGDKRTYQVTIVNTNDHAYTQTNVSVKLPLGLNFVRALEGSPAPSLSINQDGDKSLTWGNLTIPAKPKSAIAAQVQLQVELQIGNVWGELPTQVKSTSPDGAIPRKDGAIDPVIPVCPTKPAIAKDASTRIAQASDEVIYQIAVANPTDQEITGVTVEDQLPEGLTFVAPILGEAPLGSAPTQSGNKLTWNVTVPKAESPTKPGVVILKFRVKVPSNATKGTEYTNTATANGFDPTFNSVTIKVVVLEKTYLPLIGSPK